MWQNIFSLKSLSILVLGLIIATNYRLVAEGLSLHDADQFIYPLAVDQMLKAKELWLFPFDQTYGGMFFSWLRAIWIQLVEAIAESGKSHFFAHFFFSYILNIFAFAVSMLIYLKRLFGEKQLLPVAILLGTGFQFVLNLAGLDVYMMVIPLGALLLGLVRIKGEFLEASSWRRFLAFSIISGFAMSQFRMMIVFVVAAIVPWHAVARTFYETIIRANFQFRVLRGLFFFFIFLYVCILFFGKSLGTLTLWGGEAKAIVVHAGPNLKLALLIFAVIFFAKNRSFITPRMLGRLGLAGLAMIFGFLPEILHFYQTDLAPANWVLTSETQKFETWPLFASAYREFLLGYDAMSPSRSILRVGPLMLGLLAPIGLLWGSFRKPELLPAAASFVLGLIAYFQVHLSTPGPPRYLMPLFLGLIVGIHFLVVQSKNRALRVAVLGLVAMSCGYHVNQRVSWLELRTKVQPSSEIQGVAKIFEDLGLRVVLTDDYWHTLQYTFAAKGNVIFVGHTHPWFPLGAKEKALNAKRVGVLRTGRLQKNSDGSITLLGKRYFLKLIRQSASGDLYQGERIEDES